MRFMCLLKADAASEAGLPPDPDLMVRMGQFMEEIVKEGVLLATDGLHPSAKGARIRSQGGKFTVIDGPFAETKELISSYAIVQVASKEEAIEWTKRFMDVLGEDTECEIRQIMEFDEFPTDVFPPEEVAKEAALREQMAARASA